MSTPICLWGSGAPSPDPSTGHPLSCRRTGGGPVPQDEEFDVVVVVGVGVVVIIGLAWLRNGTISPLQQHQFVPGNEYCEPTMKESCSF
jgi:hypothetical protein